MRSRAEWCRKSALGRIRGDERQGSRRRKRVGMGRWTRAGRAARARRAGLARWHAPTAIGAAGDVRGMGGWGLWAEPGTGLRTFLPLWEPGEARPKHQTAGLPPDAQRSEPDNPWGARLVDEASAQGAPRWEARQGQATMDKAQGWMRSERQGGGECEGREGGYFALGSRRGPK